MKESFILTISLMLVGTLILLTGSELSTLFFVIGIFTTFNLYFRYENYTGMKNDHMRNTRDFLKDFELEYYGVFEFRDDCIRYIGESYCKWVNWIDFKEYKIKDSNLILIQKNFQEQVLVIGESEIGKTEFQKVIRFVDSKIS